MRNKILKCFSSRYTTTADFHSEDGVFLKEDGVFLNEVGANHRRKLGENGTLVQWFYNAHINAFCIIYI